MKLPKKFQLKQLWFRIHWNVGGFNETEDHLATLSTHSCRDWRCYYCLLVLYCLFSESFFLQLPSWFASTTRYKHSSANSVQRPPSTKDLAWRPNFTVKFLRSLHVLCFTYSAAGTASRSFRPQGCHHSCLQSECAQGTVAGRAEPVQASSYCPHWCLAFFQGVRHSLLFRPLQHLISKLRLAIFCDDRTWSHEAHLGQKEKKKK